jgi:hypothetical protein
MLAATLLAAAASLPLGVWPSTTGQAAVTVSDIEFYLADPEDDYSIVAFLPLAAPLKKAEPAELKRLAAMADKLGADAVILLGELPEGMIPDDRDVPLPTTGRYSAAVFVSFDTTEGWQPSPVVPSVSRRCPPQRPRHPAAARTRTVRARGMPSVARATVAGIGCPAP